MPTFLRAVTALAAAVTAVCAVVLTLHLTSADAGVRVDQLRTFDNRELTYRVYHLYVDKYPGSGLSLTSSVDMPMDECPVGVAIKEGVTFTCAFDGPGGKVEVRVTVKDSYSGELDVSMATP
ncbi:MAG: DUF4333 domain-containing protein [Saccharothrix sp.]|nr:DUF4333 domain-containing protein [Saccharothrix sp.]